MPCTMGWAFAIPWPISRILALSSTTAQKGIDQSRNACRPPGGCYIRRSVHGIVVESTRCWFNLFSMNGKQALEHGGQRSHSGNPRLAECVDVDMFASKLKTTLAFCDSKMYYARIMRSLLMSTSSCQTERRACVLGICGLQSLLISTNPRGI